MTEHRCSKYIAAYQVTLQTFGLTLSSYRELFIHLVYMYMRGRQLLKDMSMPGLNLFFLKLYVFRCKVNRKVSNENVGKTMSLLVVVMLASHRANPRTSQNSHVTSGHTKFQITQNTHLHFLFKMYPS